jgi:2-polyprenyl-3-methyl-5-hydroxy-6-metoxy-1,4-benzoquinol methylase
MNKKGHWEKVFATKQANEVSWYQQTPRQSLDFVQQLDLPKNAAIIDIGGGDSFFVDHLLQMGYNNITVLDISATAINKAKQRLGKSAASVNWVVADILEFKTTTQFDCWHDRAAFHFLTTVKEIDDYLLIAQQHLKTGGKLIIGTFSTEGPKKCSGLPVKQYNENILTNTLQKWFEKIRCITTDHITPFKTIQNFLFCSFKKVSL